MTRRFAFVVIAPVVLTGFLLFIVTGSASAQGVADLRLFEKDCTTCHGNPKAGSGIADHVQLRKMTPEAVMAGLEKPTHPQLPGVSDADKRMIAGYLGARIVDAAKLTDAKRMPNQCAAAPIGDITKSPSWNGWGNGLTNSRFQSAKAAGITAAQVPNLKLKWAFGFPAAEIVWGQPTVAAGRVFIGVDTGAVYSINAASGCVYWSFQAAAGVRNAITIAPAKGQGGAKYALYFGDVKANVYSVNADTGKLLWQTKVEEVPVARITGAPILYEDRLYVPVSSTEERAAGYSASYPCCLFRGSVVALDAATGKQIWKTYIIPDPPKPTTKTSEGVQQYGVAGGAVWNTPTIDPKNHALYIGTGDAYNHPAPKTTDAVVALDLTTGKVLWSVQDTEKDAWLAGCPQSTSENCPKDMGPDFDFGSSPILKTLPDGHRLLIAGQKSGMVWAHDPDKQGALVWKAQLVDKLALGMITFGGAADDQKAYFGLRTGGVAAVQLATGEKKWFTPIPPSEVPALRNGQTAATTVIPGVVFSGGWDGVLHALSTGDGHELWKYDTFKEFTTVNGVPAKGGSMAAPGPVVAGGMLFVGSGYTFGAGQTGNVLLAFSPQ